MVEIVVIEVVVAKVIVVVEDVEVAEEIVAGYYNYNYSFNNHHP